MKKTAKILALLLAMLLVLTACSSQTKPNETNTAASAAFVPKLDTQKAVTINAAVFFGNFEAFDQVINHFNDFYPNVTITYDQVSDTSSEEFLVDNPSIDIFMTSTSRGYPADRCVDLTAEGIDTSGIADGMLASNTVDGKVLAIPMGLTLKGMVVNKTLLEKEGLKMPQTWAEFLTVLETLKAKGYTPIQGPNSAVASLCYNMGMVMLSKDEALMKAVTSGDAAGAAALKTVFDRLMELVDKGYISAEVNADYPENNYDGAIMKFFEGDVPFWICDTEKVSGMKKRESKSETFSANPFDYEFTFAPLGDNGVYAYIDPWYGFSVNKDSSVRDYAVEFIRFLARQDELNTLASVKGVPSIARESTDTRYAGLSKLEKVEASVISNGSVYPYYGTLLEESATGLLNGEIATLDDALYSFVEKSATVQ